MKIAFDLGGVLSAHKEIRELYNALFLANPDSVFIISDMHPRQLICNQLDINEVPYFDSHVYSADYEKYGNACKSVLCKELGIDIIIDDFIGYVALPGMPAVRLLVMPDPYKPYWSENWKVPLESDFGRRKYCDE